MKSETYRVYPQRIGPFKDSCDIWIQCKDAIWVDCAPTLEEEKNKSILEAHTVHEKSAVPYK